MPILLGATNVSDIYLGTDKVKEIYLGTDLIYSSEEVADWILFNAGAVSGITWKVNYLRRPNDRNPYRATPYGVGEIGSSAMSLTVKPTYDDTTGYKFNCHVCTQELIRIPSTATKLWVQVKNQYSSSLGQPTMKFGIINADAANAVSTGTGGKFDSERKVTQTSWTNYSMTLANGMAGSSNLFRVVINNVSFSNVNTDSTLNKELDIRRVWFE